MTKEQFRNKWKHQVAGMCLYGARAHREQSTFEVEAMLNRVDAILDRIFEDFNNAQLPANGQVPVKRS